MAMNFPAHKRREIFDNLREYQFQIEAEFIAAISINKI
jgi:hypothetical protein